MYPSLPARLTLRAANRDDIPAITRLVGASELANDGMAEIHETDVRQVFDLARDGAIVVVEADGDAGGRMSATRARDLVAAAWLVEARAEVFVHPARRGQGIGSSLLAWTEERARRDGGRRIRQTVTDADEAAHSLLADHGYARAYTAWILQIALGEAPPDVALPPGIEIRPFDPARAEDTFWVIEHAFREWRGGDPQTFEHWAGFVLRHEAFEPALSRIALDGDEIVGATISYLYGGSEEGWVQQVATKATHRHRGIARALLQSSFAGFHERGLRLAGLSTDSRTGALSLYERVGMTVRRSYTSWTKELG